MKFFIPGVQDPGEAEKGWQRVRSERQKSRSREFLDKKIFKLNYFHNRREWTDEVGKPSHTNGETVLAILESNPQKTGHMVLVLTLNDTFIGGGPDTITVSTFE